MSDIYDKTVLIVDDESDVRNYLKIALEDAGFQVITAADGFEALACVKQKAPDLISLDLVMPQRSGAKFYRDLQKNTKWAAIPVLIVTGHARDELGKMDFEELTMSGPGVYLEKPVKPQNYVNAVKKLLGLEILENSDTEEEKLRNELNQQLQSADPDALKRALEALKKKT